jgi:isopentenyl diphosphate isomerase/L-lactate dehydrogenase-like FMN-dependent dehydrogenase
MVDGQSTAEGPSQNILGDAAGMRDLKMLAPISARLVEALRSRGVQMDASIASLAQLAEAVGGRHE